MKSKSVTITLAEPVKARLDSLAKATRRSRSSLVSSAIEEMLSVQEWQIKGIVEALEDADAGDLIAHEDLKHEWESRRANQVDK